MRSQDPDLDPALPKKKPNKRRGTQTPKAKGSAFERKVCERFSLWVSNLTREDVYWRSAMSGGRATLKLRKDRGREFSAQSGDISAIHPLGNLLLNYFVIECKFLRNLGLEQLIWAKQGKLENIWKKPRKEARAVGKEPLVVAKQNHRQELVLTTEAGLELLRLGLPPTAKLPLRAILPKYGIHIVFLRDVIAEVEFDRIRAWSKAQRRVKIRV